MKRKVVRQVVALRMAGVISEKAKDYLVDWVSGIRLRNARPERYPCVRRRWQDEPPAAPVAGGGHDAVKLVRVAILGISGMPLPLEEEEEVDAAELVLVTAS